jgi:LysM repeat protein
MAESMLSRKVGPIPMYGWIAGGIAVFVIVSTLRGKTAAPNNNNGSQPSGNNGNAPSPNIFFLPNGTYPEPSSLTVNVNRNPGNGGSTGQSSPPPTQPTYQPQQAGSRARVTVQKWPGSSSGGKAEWDTTLWGIAQHFGITVSELAAANQIGNPNLIYPGEQIEVP